jgi:hypothetical protein
MLNMSKVSVKDENGNVVANVKYNSILDRWDGSSWTSGSTGLHLGITILKKLDSFVLIHGTQWQGEQAYAEIVTDEETLRVILKTNQRERLEDIKYSRLKELWESKKDNENKPG